MAKNIYHPLYDVYHGAFRSISLGLLLNKKIDLETLQILDFYVLFPGFLKEFRATRTLRSKITKALSEEISNYYGFLPSRQYLFRELKPYHSLSLHYLISKSIVDHDCIESGLFNINNSKIPSDLLSFINNNTVFNNNLGEVLTEMGEMDSRGESGIKARSGLLEHRYDYV